MRLKDKDAVSKYLRQFLKSSAYLGYTTGIDMGQVTQVFRRIYKHPSAAGMPQLLDFLTTLTLSNAYFKDFDAKSRLFVEQAIDLVEENFTGTSHRTALRKDENNKDEEFKLFFFNQIPSERKAYNKILRKNLPKWEQNYIAGGKEDYFKNDSESSSDVEDIADKVRLELDSAVNPSLNRKLSEAIRGEELDDVEGSAYNISEEEDGEIQPAAPQDGEKKSYDRKASGETIHHDFEYDKFRKKKYKQLDKKEKHLLLYSNVNQKNFVDINSQDVAKAWTILFHFKGKSIESMIFEEFNSIV